MSSPTDHQAKITGAQVRRAILKARLAPFLAWAAAGLGLAFVAAFVIQAGLFAYLLPTIKPESPDVAKPGISITEDATLAGFDKSHQPYEVKAKRAWQDPDKSNIFHMETVTAQFRKTTGEAYDVSADKTRYDSQTKEADLENNVVLSERNRLTARMDRAHVDFNTKTMTSDVPVVVTMGDGTINANGMQITDDGAKILFLNGVKAHFVGSVGDGGTNP